MSLKHKRVGTITITIHIINAHVIRNSTHGKILKIVFNKSNGIMTIRLVTMRDYVINVKLYDKDDGVSIKKKNKQKFEECYSKHYF